MRAGAQHARPPCPHDPAHPLGSAGHATAIPSGNSGHTRIHSHSKLSCATRGSRAPPTFAERYCCAAHHQLHVSFYDGPWLRPAWCEAAQRSGELLTEPIEEAAFDRPDQQQAGAACSSCSCFATSAKSFSQAAEGRPTGSHSIGRRFEGRGRPFDWSGCGGGAGRASN